MKYIYLTLVSLKEGFSTNPQEGNQFEQFLIKNPLLEVILTNIIDDHCFAIDQSLVIAEAMLGGMFGGAEINTFNEKMYARIDDLRFERRKKIGNHISLVVKFTGDIDFQIPDFYRERNGTIFCFDAVDKEAIKSKNAELLAAIISGISIDLEATCNKLSEGVYFQTDDGKMLYSFSSRVGVARISISSPLSSEKQKSISEFIDLSLKLSKDLEAIYRLYTLMLESDNDRLRAFLFGWTALEILINKSFKLYKDKFLKNFTSIGLSSERYFHRIDSVMRENNKYNLLDKFNIVSSVLSPTTADDDYAIFKEIKIIRDQFTHNQSINDNDLPIEKIKLLLREYLKLHIVN